MIFFSDEGGVIFLDHRLRDNHLAGSLFVKKDSIKTTNTFIYFIFHYDLIIQFRQGQFKN